MRCRQGAGIPVWRDSYIYGRSGAAAPGRLLSAPGSAQAEYLCPLNWPV